MTGSSRGIGKAIAVSLARDGYDLGVTYHNDVVGAGETANEAKKFNVKVSIHQADFRRTDTILELVNSFKNEHRHVSGLVNNAGIYTRSRYQEITPDIWEETMRVNLKTPFILTRELAPNIVKGGSIVNIASVLGIVGSSQGVHYTASKAGLVGITKAFARELAPRIRVNCIAPGAIETDIIKDDTKEERENRNRVIPLGRVGLPEEVAGVVSFLFSKDSSFVTGAVIDCNGGYRM